MRRKITIHSTLIACALLLLAGVGSALAEDYERCPREASECVEMMMKNLSQRGWVGINFDAKGENVVLTAVVPESPAEAAGLQAGDELISLNGVAYTDGNEQEIKKIHEGLRPGDEITIVASRNGAESTHVVTLGKLPMHIMAQWVGYHMIEGHGPEEEAAEDDAVPADK